MWSTKSGHRVKAVKCHNEVNDDNRKKKAKQLHGRFQAGCSGAGYGAGLQDFRSGPESGRWSQSDWALAAVALNVNLELKRAVVHWQRSVSLASVISVTVDSNSGTYSALHITGHQFLKKYVNQQSKQ